RDAELDDRRLEAITRFVVSGLPHDRVALDAVGIPARSVRLGVWRLKKGVVSRNEALAFEMVHEGKLPQLVAALPQHPKRLIVMRPRGHLDASFDAGCIRPVAPALQQLSR